jgi:hypothetical protein
MRFAHDRAGVVRATIRVPWADNDRGVRTGAGQVRRTGAGTLRCNCHAALKSRTVALKTRTKFLVKFVGDATVTHLPSVAFLPNLIGQRLLRQISATSDRLILKTSYTLTDGSNATSLLEWSRISSSLQQPYLDSALTDVTDFRAVVKSEDNCEIKCFSHL